MVLEPFATVTTWVSAEKAPSAGFAFALYEHLMEQMEGTLFHFISGLERHLNNFFARIGSALTSVQGQDSVGTATHGRSSVVKAEKMVHSNGEKGSLHCGYHGSQNSGGIFSAEAEVASVVGEQFARLCMFPVVICHLFELM